MSKKRGMFTKSTQKVIDRNKVVSMADFLDESKEDDNIYSVPVEKIEDNPYQSRKKFDKEKLMELATSIKLHGVIQPIVIRKEGDNVILVAGERRLRASKLAGKKKIPAILTQGNALEISLIENLQRENLDPFEEAEALQKMIDKYDYTQENLAKAVGKSRPSITKSLSLNKIPNEVKEKCSRVNIPKRTLFEIARQKTEELMSVVADKVINFELKAEDIKEIRKSNEAKGKKTKSDPKDLAYKKVKSFKKYIYVLENELDEDYSETLKEMIAIQKKISEILGKFE